MVRTLPMGEPVWLKWVLISFYVVIIMSIIQWPRTVNWYETGGNSYLVNELKGYFVLILVTIWFGENFIAFFKRR